VSAGGQSGGSEGGARGGASLGFELDVGDSTTFGQQAGINAGNLTLTTGGDTTLENGTIAANDASIDVGGNLVSSSEQSTNNRVTVDLDLDPAANQGAASSALTTSADLGVGFSAENSAEVDRPSGIQIANNLDLNVDGNVTLQASEIQADSVSATIGGDVVTTSVSNSSNLIAANIGTSGIGFENESSQSITTSGITARSGNLSVTTSVAPSSQVAVTPSVVLSPAVAEEAGSTASEPVVSVNPRVAMANTRAESLIRLVSQSPEGVRQSAIQQIIGQLEESADLTSAPMLDGLTPTQKIEVLESAIETGTPQQRVIIEQTIELLRVDQLILGSNG